VRFSKILLVLFMEWAEIVIGPKDNKIVCGRNYSLNPEELGLCQSSGIFCQNAFSGGSSIPRLATERDGTNLVFMGANTEIDAIAVAYKQSDAVLRRPYCEKFSTAEAGTREETDLIEQCMLFVYNFPLSVFLL
jgi:hypothetical protein